MITLIANAPSSRLTYLADTIFKQWWNLDYKIVSSGESFDPDTCCISYGEHSVEGSIQIYSEGLLFESGVREELPVVSNHKNLPIVFQAPDMSKFDLNFDIFSAVFFCLTRYEEYLIENRDQHDRFNAEDSIFHGFQRIPYVDRWLMKLENLILQNQSRSENVRSLRWISTMDIDIAFAYKGRGIKRAIGAVGKDLINRRFDRLKERGEVLAGKAKDPFDTFDFFLRDDGADEKRVFVPVGDRSQFDINLNIENEEVKRHLLLLKTKVKVGLHPSYQSLGNSVMLKSEKSKLEKSIGEKISTSRQHFLRFKLPQTFRSLSEIGVGQDYSMGFHDEVGFRSGTAYSHQFFDLLNDEAIPLEIIPLTVMDSAMKNYLKLSTADALAVLNELLSEMKLTGGIFTTVWHNHSLSETEDWIGWRSVFLATADLVQTHR